MNYQIQCTCGQAVTVTAANDAEAMEKMIAAMDEHVAAAEHPDVPKGLTHDQKVGMVKAAMKQV